MARYFFQVHDGKDYPDEEGLELPSLGAVRERAVRYAGELLMVSGSNFWDGHDWSMDVTDDRGLTLFTLHFLAIDAPSTQQGSSTARLHSSSDRGPA